MICVCVCVIMVISRNDQEVLQAMGHVEPRSRLCLPHEQWLPNVSERMSLKGRTMSGLPFLATSLLGKRKDWLPLRPRGSLPAMPGKYPKGTPSPSRVSFRRASGPPGPGSQGDPQCGNRTALSENLQKHKPLERPEAMKPDVH